MKISVGQVWRRVWTGIDWRVVELRKRHGLHWVLIECVGVDVPERRVMTRQDLRRFYAPPGGHVA